MCTVDADGKLKKSFDGNSEQMDGLFYLSVDGNGFVMVADRMKSRILLLDSDLKFQREILTNAKQETRITKSIQDSSGRVKWSTVCGCQRIGQ